MNGPGLRYEIGLNLHSGVIVWAYGGVPCGEFSDLKLAREAFIFELEENELALADNGYKDKRFFIYPQAYPKSKAQQKLYMARHETVNRRLKQFSVLSSTFRHSLHKHPSCFYAVVNITQLMILNGHPLYDIDDSHYGNTSRNLMMITKTPTIESLTESDSA